MKKLVCLLLAGAVSCSCLANVKEETIYKWDVETKTNALTDKTEVVAVIDSNEDEDASLAVRCFDNEVDIYFIYEDELVESEMQNIAVRHDKGPVSNMEWLSSDDDTSAFVPDAAAFAKTLLKTEQLVLGFQPVTGNQRVVTFDIKGFDDVYAKATSACAK